MEVAIDLRPILGTTLVRLDPMRIKMLQSPTIYQAIDELAKLSAQSIQLRSPLTCCEKLILSDHTLYLSWEYDTEKNVSRLNGYAKVGRKHLFLYDSEMQTYEGEILCLLDFYVHYAEERKGHGKAIIDYMLQTEHAEPYQLALDNPSMTQLGFFSEHYGLTKPVWQNTNFVVFEELFKSVVVNGDADKTPEGWSRPHTPRQIGNGATETRWLRHAISGHTTHGMNAVVEVDQSPEGSLANRAHQAKARKAHILSSSPLW
uniref:Alpha-tubulin N-acetyltransferase n=1 Tax=Angiostrongylus cantonensis TaxID=6313 RepID=A0A158PCA9_ANGCA